MTNIFDTVESRAWACKLSYSQYIDLCQEHKTRPVFEYVYAQICCALTDQLKGQLDLVYDTPEEN